MITYKSVEANSLRVLKDGVSVGSIRRAEGRRGFYYQDHATKAVGETLPTVADVKASLEAK